MADDTPSLITLQVDSTVRDNFSTDFFALISWAIPIAMLMIIIEDDTA